MKVPATRFAFVLVESLYSGNVGAAARALKNNGFRGLVLVNGPKFDAEARKMAWKSLDVLRGAKRRKSLDSAVSDAKLVIGFSSRPRRLDRPLLDVDEALPHIIAASKRGKVALLFGREDRGLTREELENCQFLVRIDATRERAVYNLSQAVLLVAYRLRRARLGLDSAARQPSADSTGLLPILDSKLTSGARAHLRSKIRSALVALGYEELADPGLLERIVARSDRLLDRSGLDESDLAMLLGVIRRIEGRDDQR